MAEEKLKTAIVQTLAYSDIFEYPLSAGEIHRYLVKHSATQTEVTSALQQMASLSRNNGHYALGEKTQVFGTRQERTQASRGTWRKARVWSWVIAHLPFVRMVAVTGTLAVDNIEQTADVDFLIVTAPGRLWLCRAMILGLDRVSRWFGVTLCPNYLVTTNALHFEDHSLFTAREVTQMVPLSGMSIYDQIRAENSWVQDWLPNAEGAPRPDIKVLRVQKWLQTLLELPLKNVLGDKLEQWEMQRKVSKFNQQNLNNDETQFATDYCKGHFDGHGKRTKKAYESRLEALKDNAG